MKCHGQTCSNVSCEVQLCKLLQHYATWNVTVDESTWLTPIKSRHPAICIVRLSVLCHVLVYFKQGLHKCSIVSIVAVVATVEGERCARHEFLGAEVLVTVDLFSICEYLRFRLLQLSKSALPRPERHRDACEYLRSSTNLFSWSAGWNLRASVSSENMPNMHFTTTLEAWRCRMVWRTYRVERKRERVFANFDQLRSCRQLRDIPLYHGRMCPEPTVKSCKILHTSFRVIPSF